jgi:excisionase family DNA binding protein
MSDTTNPEPGSYGVPYVANVLGCHQMTVRREIKAGIIPAFKVGRQYRVRHADLNALLETSAAHPDVAPAPLDSAR